MKKIAVANDISGFGKCSLSVALPIISALGVQCCPLVTGVFSNQTDFPHFHGKDLTDFISPCVEAWKKMGFSFDGILTGYIASAKQGEILSDFIESFSNENTVVVIDPVMGDSGEVYKGFEKERIDAVKKLVNKADIITPNLTELCILTNNDYKKITALSKEDMLFKIEEMSQSLLSPKLKTVITTGIHCQKDKLYNCVFTLDGFSAISVNSKGGRFSGTGDIFSSFICANAVKGKDIKESVQKAADFIYKAICETLEKEDGTFDKNNGIHFESLLHTLS